MRFDKTISLLIYCRNTIGELFKAEINAKLTVVHIFNDSLNFTNGKFARMVIEKNLNKKTLKNQMNLQDIKVWKKKIKIRNLRTFTLEFFLMAVQNCN